MAFAMVCSSKIQAQDKQSINGYLVPMCIYNGDTIPCIQLRTVYIFRPLKFKNEKERLEYYDSLVNFFGDRIYLLYVTYQPVVFQPFFFVFEF